MEKIVTLLWRPEGVTAQAFANTLLNEVKPALLAESIRGLKICVHDDDTAVGEKLQMLATDQPKAAMVSYWIDMAQARDPIENVLQQHASKLLSFLVIESTPIVNTSQAAAPGERTPGFSQVTCVRAREDLSKEEFLNIWHNEHMACAIETQSTFQYIRNEIVRPLTGEGPEWTAIVEEGFPAAAMENPEVFYDALGDQPKFKANLDRMITTVSKFLAMEGMDVTAMSEYVIERL
ncbi:MAG: EthD domain-containing protein [Pseudomonadales bacterium]